MKIFRKIIFTLLLFSICFGDQQNWKSHSANILPKKRFEVGLFQPFRYGYSETLEYSTYPVWFFVMPNLTLKKSHNSLSGYDVASRWSLFYPRPILNMVSRKDIGGFIDPTLKVPPLLGISASMLFTKIISGVGITFNSGLDIGIPLGDLDGRVNIELPLLYHRLSVFHNKYGFHTGFALEKSVTGKLSAIVDLDLSILPGMDTKKTDSGITKLLGEYSFEHKALLIYEKSETFRFLTGYKFVFGEYPFGSESRLLPFLPLVDSWIPMIELQWGRSLK
ncbi:MAG: hypothetical protein ACJZ1R_00915 [Candidatus Neomarinimicrobiota bacterium]